MRSYIKFISSQSLERDTGSDWELNGTDVITKTRLCPNIAVLWTSFPLFQIRLIRNADGLICCLIFAVFYRSFASEISVTGPSGSGPPLGGGCRWG